MKLIFGMAKSQLDLKGAKGPKLELDYLRLAYVVKQIESVGGSAQGYLVILAPNVLDRVRQWEAKYQARGCVNVVYVPLPNNDINELKREKANNIAGMVAGTTGSKVGGLSTANFGRDIGEMALERKILELEPGVRRITDSKKFPFGIKWDFYGETLDQMASIPSIAGD